MSTVSAFLLRVPSLPIRAFNESRSSSSSSNGESCKTQETHFSIIRMQSEAELKSPPLQQGTNALSHSRRGALWLGFSVGLLPLLESFCVQNQSAMAEGEVPCVLSTAPSGLAFCDRVVGTGSEATKGQLIKAHYVGKLENGKVFDSSYSRGEPLAFRVGVGEVIKGWDQGILGGDGIPPMLAGGKRTLKLPPELGYGMRGAGCKGGSCIIPPDSVLVFDVEFIGKA